MGIVLIDFNITTTINGKLCVAAISKETVTVNFCIHFTIDSNFRSHLESIIAAAIYKGYAIVTIGTILGGKPPCIVFISQCSDISIKGNIRITCRIKAKGISFAMNQHVHITVDGKFIGIIRILLSLSANTDTFDSSVIRSPYDQFICCNSDVFHGISRQSRYRFLAVSCRNKSQRMVLRIDIHRMIHIAYINGISSLNSGVLGEFIVLSIIFQYAGIHVFLICTSYAGNSIGKFSIRLGCRNFQIIIESLTSNLCTSSSIGEGNLSCLQFFRRRRKAISYFHNSGKMSIRITGVVQFISQLVQDTSHQCLICFTVAVFES